MGKLINAIAKQKPIGAQAYPDRNFTLSSDAILLLKPDGGQYELTLKPEYNSTLRQALGIHERAEMSLFIEKKDYTALIEMG